MFRDDNAPDPEEFLKSLLLDTETTGEDFASRVVSQKDIFSRVVKPVKTTQKRRVSGREIYSQLNTNQNLKPKYNHNNNNNNHKRNNINNNNNHNNNNKRNNNNNKINKNNNNTNNNTINGNYKSNYKIHYRSSSKFTQAKKPKQTSTLPPTQKKIYRFSSKRNTNPRRQRFIKRTSKNYSTKQPTIIDKATKEMGRKNENSHSNNQNISKSNFQNKTPISTTTPKNSHGWKTNINKSNNFNNNRRSWGQKEEPTINSNSSANISLNSNKTLNQGWRKSTEKPFEVKQRSTNIDTNTNTDTNTDVATDKEIKSNTGWGNNNITQKSTTTKLNYSKSSNKKLNYPSNKSSSSKYPQSKYKTSYSSQSSSNKKNKNIQRKSFPKPISQNTIQDTKKKDQEIEKDDEQIQDSKPINRNSGWGISIKKYSSNNFNKNSTQPTKNISKNSTTTSSSSSSENNNDDTNNKNNISNNNAKSDINKNTNNNTTTKMNSKTINNINKTKKLNYPKSSNKKLNYPSNKKSSNKYPQSKYKTSYSSQSSSKNNNKNNQTKSFPKPISQNTKKNDQEIKKNDEQIEDSKPINRNSGWGISIKKYSSNNFNKNSTQTTKNISKNSSITSSSSCSDNNNNDDNNKNNNSSHSRSNNSNSNSSSINNTKSDINQKSNNNTTTKMNSKTTNNINKTKKLNYPKSTSNKKLNYPKSSNKKLNYPSNKTSSSNKYPQSKYKTSYSSQSSSNNNNKNNQTKSFPKPISQNTKKNDQEIKKNDEQIEDSKPINRNSGWGISIKKYSSNNFKQNSTQPKKNISKNSSSSSSSSSSSVNNKKTNNNKNNNNNQNNNSSFGNNNNNTTTNKNNNITTTTTTTTTNNTNKYQHNKYHSNNINNNKTTNSNQNNKKNTTELKQNKETNEDRTELFEPNEQKCKEFINYLGKYLTTQTNFEKHFVQPLKKTKILKHNETFKLFGRFNTFYLNQKNIYEKLKNIRQYITPMKVVNNSTNHNPNSNPDNNFLSSSALMKIADCFTQFRSEHFEYILKNYENNVQTIFQLLQKHNKISSIFEEGCKKTQAIDFVYFYSQPLKVLNEYLIFFSGLEMSFQRINSTLYYNKIHRRVESIEKIIKSIKSNLLKLEHISELNVLTKTFQNSKEKLDLLKPERKLIYVDYALSFHKKKVCKYYIFNDLILFAMVQKNKYLIPLDLMFWESVTVRELTDNQRLEIQYGVEILVMNDEKRYTYVFKQLENKANFFRSLEIVKREQRGLRIEKSVNPTNRQTVLFTSPINLRKERERGVEYGKETKMKKRALVIIELVKTEEDYVKDLNTIINHFLIPLREQKIVSEKDVPIIFGHIEMIYGFNNELLKLLKENFPGENENAAKMNVGKIFIQMADFLKVYAQYCSKHEISVQKVVKYRQNNKFSQFISQQQAQIPQIKNLYILDFLIKPIQRICKYPLLFRELLKATSIDYSDYNDLKEAFLKISEVADYVNEKKRNAENQMEILHIYYQISGIEKKLELVKPHRRFVMEGLLKKRSNRRIQQRQFWLFNDILLYAKPKFIKTKNYQYKGCIRLENAMIRDFETKNGEYKFQIIPYNTKKDYKFWAETEEDMKKWVTTIKQQIDNLR
ncbi:faciogenital dysplasia protein [Anaeramoeba flamelloides]|uniref:Faciogenital dysplasia protein n=1 Tax=Anaeramoeba flamelloides TaxID=1746091 RepID=A0AAV7YXH5_9EUKA|nr:faciogenital dysplasia protein [Anaeramoeba flamelloides]